MTPERWPALEGRYHYRRDGKIMPVTEWYHCKQEAGDRWSLVSERKAPGVSIMVAAALAEGVIQSASIDWQAEGEAPLRLSCRWGSSGLRTERQDGVAAREVLELPLTPDDATLFPLLRVFTGAVFEFLEPIGSGRVVIPAIDAPEDRDALLRPRTTERQLISHGSAAIEVDGQAQDCREYEYLGDQYGPDTRFWLADGGLLVRYRWPTDEGTWEVSWGPVSDD